MVAGIDPSSTATGLVILEVTTSLVVKVKEALELPKYGAKHSRARTMRLADDLATGLLEYDVERAVIEGYAYGNAHSLATMVEIGMAYRTVLDRTGTSWSWVAPNGLKKFCGAKGKKDRVRLAVYKRWGFEHPSDNVVDAYVLARIALALDVGMMPDLAEEAEVLGTIRTRERTEARWAESIEEMPSPWWWLSDDIEEIP